MERYSIKGMSCAACVARVEKAASKVEGVTACSVNLLTESMMIEGNADSEQIIEAVEKAGYEAELVKRVSAAGSGSEGLTNAEKHNSQELNQSSMDNAGNNNDNAGNNNDNAGNNDGKIGNKNGNSQKKNNGKSGKERKQEKGLLARLITSLVFLLILMYFSMGHSMWGFPVPAVVAQNPVVMGLIQLLLTCLILVINQRFFISGYRSLTQGAPNMDTLVALGSTAAFGYSVWSLFGMAICLGEGNLVLAREGLSELYFESAATIVTLITLGKLLEAHSKGKTTDALKGLMRLTPETITVLREEQEVVIPIGQAKKGDVFLVRPGDSIPVDGVVLEGNSAVNEASLTGESIPVDKAKGSAVSAGTMNQSGFLKCEATKVGEDTTLSRIIQLVSDAAATKAPVARIADKVAGVFVPTVLCIALITIAVWLLLGETVGFALARGISVLVISCPCALGLATPVAIMVGTGVGAKNGILFKTAVALEETGKAKVVVLDKTGTITKGAPQVTDFVPGEGVTTKELLQLAWLLEQKSEHPLAKAIMDEARKQGLGENSQVGSKQDLSENSQTGKKQDLCENSKLQGITGFKALPGHGVTAFCDGKQVWGGNLQLITDKCSIPSGAVQSYETLTKEGKTPLCFATEDKWYGMIAVADELKEESREAVKQLQNMGMKVVMLTGDNQNTANAIGKKAGVNQVISGVLPDGKEEVIRSFKEKSKVIMVGDGINDAPALTRADVGIAIGAGADVARDAADVILMKSSLLDVPAAIRLSRTAMRNIRENLFWAFFYNCIGIPLAAGVFIRLLGWELNPMFGAAAMSLSSFCVVTNALRLNLCKVYNAHKDRKHKLQHSSMETDENLNETECGVTKNGADSSEIKNNKITSKENRTMEKTIKVEGMMCGHCEMHVKKALEAIDGVSEAIASHEQGNVVVKLDKEVSDDVLNKAITDAGYEVK